MLRMNHTTIKPNIHNAACTGFLEVFLPLDPNGRALKIFYSDAIYLTMIVTNNNIQKIHHQEGNQPTLMSRVQAFPKVCECCILEQHSQAYALFH